MKLFVGNLSFGTTETDLQELFATYGTVIESRILHDRDTGRSRGLGFVTMSSAEEGQGAIQGLNGTDFMGRVIRVDQANEKPPRPRYQNESREARRREFADRRY